MTDPRPSPDDAQGLLPEVYTELRALAAAQLEGERRGHTLQPTALVHEVYLRLAGQDRARLHGRVHVLAVAAEAMRRVLVDHARARRAAKRGGGARPVTLGDATLLPERPELDLEALDAALAKLQTLNPRHFEVVKLRFFGGLSGEEIADVLGVSRVTVTKDWKIAKAWLLAELDDSGDAAPRAGEAAP